VRSIAQDLPANVDAPQLATVGNGDRETIWDILVDRAGKPNHGRVLSARGLREEFTLGTHVPFLVITQSVSTIVINWARRRGDDPLILVRDESDKPVARTKKGLRRFGPDWGLNYMIGSDNLAYLEPGCAEGITCDLSEFYVFEKPGTYTAIFAESGCGGGAVSKPVRFRITAPSQSSAKVKTTAGGGNKMDAAPRFGSDRPNDKDWRRLAGTAGKAYHSLYLTALRSPVDSSAIIVSLARLDNVQYEAVPKNEQQSASGQRELYYQQEGIVPAPNSALSSQNYWVFVRGPSGRPFTMINHQAEPGPKPPFKPSENPETDLYIGGAIGAAIPITKWFDMTEPGEYSVLIALPSSEQNGPVWVAEPLKFMVPAKPAEHKK
jgi:hypothetical protein